MLYQVDAKLVGESGHKPTPLSPAERADLASITQHPGMWVLIGKILEAHARQQVDRIHTVSLADADRSTKIEAICSVAQGMTLTAEVVKMEIMHNWKTIQDAEIARAKAAEQNETEKTK